MDNAKLIRMVAERKQLWDARDHNYHNRDYSRTLWLEIADEMHCTSHVAKTKWQNLRDTYRKEYMKLVRDNTGRKVSHWKYFDKMKFLDSVMALRRRPEQASGTESNERTEEFADVITPVRYLCEVPRTATTDGDSDAASGRGDASNDASLDGDVRSFADPYWVSPGCAVGVGDANNVRWTPGCQEWRRANDSTDEDYHFAMSLVPHLRDIPKRRKLYVRQKLERLLMDELYRTTYTRRPRGKRHEASEERDWSSDKKDVDRRPNVQRTDNVDPAQDTEQDEKTVKCSRQNVVEVKTEQCDSDTDAV